MTRQSLNETERDNRRTKFLSVHSYITKISKSHESTETEPIVRNYHTQKFQELPSMSESQSNCRETLSLGGSRSSVTQRMRTRIVTSKKSTTEAKKSFHIERPNQVAHSNVDNYDYNDDDDDAMTTMSK